MAPLGFMLANDHVQTVVGSIVDTCMTNSADYHSPQSEIFVWISNFMYSEERLTNALTTGAFLANQAWTKKQRGRFGKTHTNRLLL